MRVCLVSICAYAYDMIFFFHLTLFLTTRYSSRVRQARKRMRQQGERRAARAAHRSLQHPPRALH